MCSFTFQLPRFHSDVTCRGTWSSGNISWQKILGGRASLVFCRDSILVCINFTHTQDHDFVLYCVDSSFYFVTNKKGKTKKNLVECVQL